MTKLSWISIVVTAALFFSTGWAVAEMPRFDVEAHCTEVAGFGGEYSAVMFDGCFDMEQNAYNNLKARWDSLSPSVRSYCHEVATFGGHGSYSMFEGCVQMEEAASAEEKSFQY